MKTTILTVLLAATAVMGAGISDALCPPNGYHWELNLFDPNSELKLVPNRVAKKPRPEIASTNINNVVTNRLSTNVFASTSITNLVLSKEQIEHLCSSGQVCNVKGHMWRDGRPGEGNGAMYADFHPGVSYRTCKICGKCQTKSEEWND